MAGPVLYSIELRTEQWEEMLRWYRDALGLRVCLRVPEDRFALLAAVEAAPDGASSVAVGRIALLGRTRVAHAAGRISFSFEVADLDAAAARLAEGGWLYSEPKTNREGFRELVTQDIDGNQIRLFQWPDKAES